MHDTWQDDCVFETCVDSDLPAVPAYVRVVVAKAIISRRLRFSLYVEFRRGDEERGVRFFPMISKGQGTVSVIDYGPALSKVMADAQAYCVEELQKFEDAKIETMQEREKKYEPRPGVVTRHPATVRVGKTERDKNKNKNA